MNTSFSKKRHILEVNQRLEKRFLIERIESSLDVILKEQTTQNNPQAVNPKDKKWYENFPCLKRDVGMELLKPKKLKDGTFVLKNYGNDSYFPDGTVYLSSTESFDVWYCLRSDLTYHKNDKNDAGYIEALKKGWAVEFTGDLNTRAAPVTDKAQTQNGQKKIDQYWYKKFSCLTNEVADRKLKVKRMPDRSVVLHEEKYNLFYFEDGTAYYGDTKSNRLWYCFNSNFSTIAFDTNDEYYQNAIKNGKAVEYKGDLKSKPTPDIKSLETQVKDEPPKPETPITPPTQEITPPTQEITPPTQEITPPTQEITPAPLISVISDESQNIGNTGVKSTDNVMINIYNEVAKTGNLNQTQLQYCASILSNWYKDWQDEIIYPQADYEIFKKAAQSCVNQVNPNFFTSIFGQRGGKIDRNTGKLINILTRKGKSPVSPYSIYRLYKK